MKQVFRIRQNIRNQRIWKRTDKLNYIESYFDSADGRMLEIGPSIAPMWNVKKFPNVRYLETCDSAGLDIRAEERGKKNPIEKVHYVFHPEKGFHDSIENSSGYNYVSSSHVIEHIPDFISHLKGIEAITVKNGYYFAIVPDKNLIFDKARPCSSLGDIVSYHFEEKSGLSAMIDSLFYSVDDSGNNGRGWWNLNDQPELKMRHDRNELSKLDINKIPEAKLKNWSGHYHVFNPMSFSKLISGLNLLGLLNMSLCDVVSTGHMDFIAVFKNDDGSSSLPLKDIVDNLDNQNYPYIDRLLKD